MCIPALIYLVYAIIYILIDVKNNLYDNIIIKSWISILIFAVLNVLCNNDLTILAWLMICIPFIYMVYIMAILFYTFNVNLSSGTVTYESSNSTYTGPPPVQSNTTDISNTYIIDISNTQTTPTITISPTTFGIGL